MIKKIKRILLFLGLIIIFNITDLNCASTVNKGNIYKDGDFTMEIKYYDSCKNEKCYCPEPKENSKYICQCLDTCDKK